MTNEQKWTLARIITAMGMLVALFVIPMPEGVARILFLIPYLVIGYDILWEAVESIFHRELFDENFLMAVATVGAFALGESAEAVAVMLFYQIGELFQDVAVGKSRQSILDLMDIRPDYAMIQRPDGQTEKVAPENVPVGTEILVKPGEKIPLDGVVTAGSSSLHMGALTGESTLKEVEIGTLVMNGAVNMDGLLKIKTTKEYSESTVAKILELVEHSEAKKSKSENFITQFARIYTPIVCVGAVLLAILPPVFLLLMGQEMQWSVWVQRALTFLVISCPCALVMSIPLSFFAGIGAAAKKGILVKGSNYLEALARAKTVVFDKTGTLTKGVFEVVGIYPSSLGILSEGEQDPGHTLLAFANAAERYSTHPIAKSIAHACNETNVEMRVEDVTEMSAHGVSATVNGHRVIVGNLRLMHDQQILVSDESTHPHTEAGSQVYVAIDGQYAGAIALADVIKVNAPMAIRALKAVGVQRTVMLTGDSKAAATKIAAQLSLEEVKSELLPADKVMEVEQLLAQKQSTRDVLVFVGDGINDAPVLMRSDVGIAMGALGSDAAIEAADVVLMDDNLHKLPTAMRISQKCLRIVTQNIVFALGIKAICLVLGTMGIANMWVAIFADVGVMVLAVINALRCLRTHPVKAA
ncbi:MAG: heavy metal translocating P-type ATPase [Lachnospiraceae bacterium]|jgi:Cd2+/Zn2+-exporting ATPase|nr:heavy metal translocating P-type ATPase [Lachnospiraceae bacterium]